MNNMFRYYGYTTEAFIRENGQPYSDVKKVINHDLIDPLKVPYGSGLDKMIIQKWEENIKQECKDNIFFFFTNFVMVRNPDIGGSFIPFTWNRSKYCQILLDDYKVNNYIRAPRQISGKTTTIAAQVLYHELFRNDFCIVVTENRDEMQQKVGDMNFQLPDFMKKRPNKFKDSVIGKNLIINSRSLNIGDIDLVAESIKEALKTRDVYVFLDDVEIVDRDSPGLVQTLIELHEEQSKKQTLMENTRLVICASGVSFSKARNTLRKEMYEISATELTASVPPLENKFGYFVRFTDEDYKEMPNFEKFLHTTKANLTEEIYEYEIKCKD